MNLLNTTDAREWAKDFVSRFGGDESLMLTWFANAIQTGVDHEHRKHLPPGCGGRTAADVLKEMIRVQGENLTSPYMVGLYNGLYTAFATITGKDLPCGLKEWKPSDENLDCPVCEARRTAQTTHYEGCWRHHLECAVAEIERLRLQARNADGLRLFCSRPFNGDEADLRDYGQDVAFCWVAVKTALEKQKAAEARLGTLERFAARVVEFFRPRNTNQQVLIEWGKDLITKEAKK